MIEWAYLGLALALGAGHPMQLALISAMGRAMNARAAAWISALGTFTALAILLGLGVVTGDPSGLPGPFHLVAAIFLAACGTGTLLYFSARRLPPYFAATGLIATANLVGSAFLVPRLGLAPVFAATTLGTVTSTLIVDHLAPFGAQHRRITGGRVLGIALVALGTILVRIAD